MAQGTAANECGPLQGIADSLTELRIRLSELGDDYEREHGQDVFLRQIDDLYTELDNAIQELQNLADAEDADSG